jgi:hypothetical protein
VRGRSGRGRRRGNVGQRSGFGSGAGGIECRR